MSRKLPIPSMRRIVKVMRENGVAAFEVGDGPSALKVSFDPRFIATPKDLLPPSAAPLTPETLPPDQRVRVPVAPTAQTAIDQDEQDLFAAVGGPPIFEKA